MGYALQFGGLGLTALASGALWCAEHATLMAADLHLGRAGRSAVAGGVALPPYEAADTLARLAADIDACAPRRVVLLGDSFDSAAIRPDLPAQALALMADIAAAVDLVFVRGNHDPGAGVAGLRMGAVTLRHIAGQGPDISGHFHPKLGFAGAARRVFVMGAAHLILPAYGGFTGGLGVDDPALARLVPRGIAVTTGAQQFAVPLPLPARPARRRARW